MNNKPAENEEEPMTVKTQTMPNYVSIGGAFKYILQKNKIWHKIIPDLSLMMTTVPPTPPGVEGEDEEHSITMKPWYGIGNICLEVDGTPARSEGSSQRPGCDTAGRI